MKNTTTKPLQTNQGNGTLKGPKSKAIDVSKSSKGKPSGLRPKEKMACLDKGGKACID